jgi:hypothetical protein
VTWGAFLGGLIGASIPAVLTYIGLRRARQSNDAEAFGPALLLPLLYRVQPDRVMVNISPEPSVRTVRLMKLSQETDTARERLLVVSAGHPRRRVRDLAGLAQVKLGNANHAKGWQVADMQMGKDNPEWVDHYREDYAEAETAMRDLIDANFAWADPRPTAILRRVRGCRARTSRPSRHAHRHNHPGRQQPPGGSPNARWVFGNDRNGQQH